MKTITITEMTNLSSKVQNALDELYENLGFIDETIKVIMITSSVHGEGKSFASMNFWKKMAENGKKTVFIDADMQNSVLRERNVFSCDSEMKGIEYFLSGKAKIDDVLYQTNIENGYMIPTGRNIAEPSSLINSIRFTELLKTCRNEFDYVIVDTPSMVSEDEVLRIAELSDGYLFVVGKKMASRRNIRKAMNLLKGTEKSFLGVVLNKA